MLISTDNSESEHELRIYADRIKSQPKISDVFTYSYCIHLALTGNHFEFEHYLFKKNAKNHKIFPISPLSLFTLALKSVGFDEFAPIYSHSHCHFSVNQDKQTL